MVSIVIAHKVGDCPVGDTSVVIAISSEHRRNALDAVSFAIDELKATVPVWKKEVYSEGDGDSVWKKNKEFDKFYSGTAQEQGHGQGRGGETYYQEPQPVNTAANTSPVRSKGAESV